MAALLTEIGTQYRRDPDPVASVEQAWQRHRHACLLSPANRAAVSRCLGMIDEEPGLDPEFAIGKGILTGGVKGWLDGTFAVGDTGEQLEQIEEIFVLAGRLLQRTGEFEGAPTRVQLSGAAANLEIRLRGASPQRPPHGRVLEDHGLALMMARDYVGARRFLELARSVFQQAGDAAALARCDREIAEAAAKETTPADATATAGTNVQSPPRAPPAITLGSKGLPILRLRSEERLEDGLMLRALGGPLFVGLVSDRLRGTSLIAQVAADEYRRFEPRRQPEPVPAAAPVSGGVAVAAGRVAGVSGDLVVVASKTSISAFALNSNFRSAFTPP